MPRSDLVDIDNPPDGFERCPKCDGKGVIWGWDFDDPGAWVDEMCPVCLGELIVPGHAGDTGLLARIGAIVDRADARIENPELYVEDWGYDCRAAIKEIGELLQNHADITPR